MFWKKEKLILQYASRRGGSTIFSQLLEAETNVGSIDQPFDLWKPESSRGKIIKEHLPFKEMSQFFELDSNEKTQVKQYLQKIYNRELLQLSNKSKNKIQLLKIVNAQGLIDDLSVMAPSISIILLRHPCSQALSVVNNKWGTCEQPFLESKKWTSNYLTEEQIEFGIKISKDGSYLDRAILNWCLEWHYVFQFSNQKHLTLYYENMVLNPKEFIDNLFNYLNFKNKEKALLVLKKPSRSSQYSTKEALQNIKEGNKDNLLSNWRKHFSQDGLNMAQLILDVFQVSKYKVNSNIPIT